MALKEAISSNDPAIQKIVQAAIESGTKRYISDCRHRIDYFCEVNYSFCGTLKIHKKAFGWDLIKVPINIAWSIVVLVVSTLAYILDKFHLSCIARKLRRLPVGFATDVDRYISHKLLNDLFRMPFPDKQLGWKEATGRDVKQDELQRLILETPELLNLLNKELKEIRHLMLQGYREKIYSNLEEYGASKTGVADLAGNLLGAVITKTTLGSAAFGTLGAGSAVSLHLANSTAVAGFWAGSQLGSLYYGFVPVSVSKTLLFSTTAAIAIFMAFVSTFIGVFTDPIQLKYGIHQKRLHKVVDSLESELSNGQSELNLKEKYAGKIFDLIDILSQIKKVS